MVRQGNGKAAETDLPELSESEPHLERRLNERHPARSGAIAEIRCWSMGSIANFGLQLVDLSIRGIRVKLNRMVQSGDRLEVTLWPPNRGWSIRCMAVVRWCSMSADNGIIAGLRLSRPIAKRDFEELVQSSLE